MEGTDNLRFRSLLGREVLWLWSCSVQACLCFMFTLFGYEIDYCLVVSLLIIDLYYALVKDLHYLTENLHLNILLSGFHF